MTFLIHAWDTCSGYINNIIDCYFKLFFSMNLQFTEEEFVLRTLQLHLTQCSYVERPGISSEEKQHFSKVYGVNRKSILCDLPDFDITTQLPQDIMHVLFEGLFHLQVRLFLNYLIDDLKVSSCQ